MPSGPPATPILWICCGYLIGQLAAPWTPGRSFSAAAVTAAIGVAVRSPRRQAARLVATAAMAAAIGHWQLDDRLTPALDPGHVAELVRGAPADAMLRGTIIDPPAERPAGLRFTIDVDAKKSGDTWIAAHGRVLLTVRQSARYWRRGDRLEARVRLRPPRNFGNPGEFDYEQFLARRAVYLTGYDSSDAAWRRLPRPEPPAWNDALRDAAATALDHVASPHLQPIATALLLGDVASIPEPIRERYARAGVSHILSISGLHVGLVAAAAFLAARWLLARSERVLLTANVPKMATVASLPPVIVYAAIAGSSAATLRANIMAALFLAAMLLDRRRHWPTAVAGAASAVCAASPGALFEASFQLSFAAVIAIVAGGRPLRDLLDAAAEHSLWRLTHPRLLGVARGAVLSQGVTTLALLATAPLTLYHFQQLSLVGLISNFFVVPLTGFAAVGSGLAGVLLTPALPGIGACLLAVCCAFLTAGDWLTAWFANLPGADLHLITPNAFETALYYAVLALPLVPAPRPRAAAAGTVALLSALQIASWRVEHNGEDLRITFISVGQGDSALVEFPGGHVMLVDGGGLSPGFDVGQRVIAPLLLRRKIDRIDTVVLTHPDFDHYGGLPYIVERFSAPELWHNGSRGDGASFAKLLETAERSATRHVQVQRGFARNIGGADVRILHPSPGAATAENDSSVVLSIRYGGVGVLLTGDIEEGGERALLRAGSAPRADILKVPHHGSRSSSTEPWLTAVQPRIAVASCGHRNRYGMPHPTVIDRYARHGIALLRTDRDGAVEIRISSTGATSTTIGRRGRRSLDRSPRDFLWPPVA